MSETEEETPYAQARRLHAAGTSAEAIERTLQARGLTEEDARIAARAARGEAGSSLAMSSREAPASLDTEPPATPPTHPCPTHPEWPVSGTCVRCGKFFCDRCLTQAGHQTPPASKQCPECEARFPVGVVAGIGGWLILPAIHIVVSPLAHLALLVQMVATMSRFGVQPAMVVALLMSVVMFGYCLLTAFQFFRKKRVAVTLMLGFYGLNAVTAVLSVISSNADVELTSLGRSLLSSVVWAGYFLQSKRVAATFVVD